MGEHVTAPSTAFGSPASRLLQRRLCRRVLLAASLLICGIAAAAPVWAGGVWRRGETADPGSLDPHKTSTSVEQHILDELYEGLTIYDGHGDLKPGVAASWRVSADGLVYTFLLRPDARWSTGERVTADDFVFAFRRLMNPTTGAGYANILYTVKNARGVNTGHLPVEALGIRAIDAGTLEITLEHPATYFLEQLTHMTAMPIYRPGLARWGDAFARAGRLVGNGAFVLKRYVPNDRLVLVKNPFFHDAVSVALDGEEILPISDRSAGLRRFMAGEIDSYNEIPIDQIGFIRHNLAATLRLTPSLGTYYYTVDTRTKPFDDTRVRQALSMVIDRDFLSDRIWGGTTRPSTSFVPPGIPGYGAPATTTWSADSLYCREDKARALIKAAGFTPDHPLRATIRFEQSENHQATAVAIADMWKTLGVATDFIVTDATTFFSYLASGQPYDVARSGWFADFPYAENYLFLAESDNKGLNSAHFADAGFDDLMRQANGETENGKRQNILHQAEALLLSKQPYMPLLTYDAPNLVSPHVQGWTANILDHHPGRYISKD